VRSGRRRPPLLELPVPRSRWSVCNETDISHRNGRGTTRPVVPLVLLVPLPLPADQGRQRKRLGILGALARRRTADDLRPLTFRHSVRRLLSSHTLRAAGQKCPDFWPPLSPKASRITDSARECTGLNSRLLSAQTCLRTADKVDRMRRWRNGADARESTAAAIREPALSDSAGELQSQSGHPEVWSLS
jgi:hypothetical protein